MRLLASWCVALLAISAAGVYGEEKCLQKDQDFGLPLTANDILTSVMSPWMFREYYRPWRYLESLTRDLGSTIKVDKDKFQINLDMQHFGQDEVNVKTENGYVVVEAKHEEKQDAHGYVSRQFVRRYELPEGVDPEDVAANLSSDGILTITAPRSEVHAPGVRRVPISLTGPAKMEPKESKDSCSKDECEKL